MPQDTFSSRLDKDPNRAYVGYYRKPKFEQEMSYLWDPLLALNRSQAIALAEAGILDPDESESLLGIIDELEAVDVDEFDRYEEFGGSYAFIEDCMTAELGVELGGKLHTGRSRNDLKSAAIRMAVRDRILTLVDATLSLREQLLDRAEQTVDVVFPAFTHSQPAQPITFAHYLLAVDGVVSRDVRRLRRAYEETNRSPLGAAAIGGTGFPLDRERLAELSGFDGVVRNTYDAIASVDYLPEAASALGLLMTTLSRVAQDLLIWNMFEVGFVELSERMSSASSIMPQKKNPGALEKVRSGSSRSISCANDLLVSLQSVPYGDVGETAYISFPFLEEASNAERLLRLFAAVVEDLQVNDRRMYADAQESFCTMTELADTLVREADLSFRQAHEVVGTLVRNVLDDGRRADEITIADLDEASRTTVDDDGPLPEAELESALDPTTNVARRDILGGTAPDQNRKGLADQRSLLDDQQQWLHEVRDRLDAAREKRLNAT